MGLYEAIIIGILLILLFNSYWNIFKFEDIKNRLSKIDKLLKEQEKLLDKAVDWNKL